MCMEIPMYILQKWWLFSMVVSTIGLTAFAGAAANADENVGKYI